ncbi:hypothetical protein ACOSP7_009803 [Xanthoceras sorbifolium]
MEKTGSLGSLPDSSPDFMEQIREDLEGVNAIPASKGISPSMDFPVKNKEIIENKNGRSQFPGGFSSDSILNGREGPLVDSPFLTEASSNMATGVPNVTKPKWKCGACGFKRDSSDLGLTRPLGKREAVSSLELSGAGKKAHVDGVLPTTTTVSSAGPAQQAYRDQ